MSQPTVETTTLRLYNRLPDTYRQKDEENNWAFLSFLDGVIVSLGIVDTLRNEFMYVPGSERPDYIAAGTDNTDYGATYDTSRLLDGATADSEWLPWLMLLVGADSTKFYTDTERRAAILNPFAGYRAGSRESLRQSVLELLTGTKYLRVFDHSKVELSAITAGTEFQIVLVTKEGETPSGDLVETIIRKGAKPAGIELFSLGYSISWASFETLYPTWADVDGLDWGTIEGSGSELT